MQSYEKETRIMKSLYIKLPSHSFFKGKNKKTCINICVVQKNLLPLHSQNCKATVTLLSQTFTFCFVRYIVTRKIAKHCSQCGMAG